jgi:hypothetical protein
MEPKIINAVRSVGSLIDIFTRMSAILRRVFQLSFKIWSYLVQFFTSRTGAI